MLLDILVVSVIFIALGMSGYYYYLYMASKEDYEDGKRRIKYLYNTITEGESKDSVFCKLEKEGLRANFESKIENVSNYVVPLRLNYVKTMNYLKRSNIVGASNLYVNAEKNASMVINLSFEGSKLVLKSQEGVL